MVLPHIVVYPPSATRHLVLLRARPCSSTHTRRNPARNQHILNLRSTGRLYRGREGGGLDVDGSTTPGKILTNMN